MKGVVEIPLFFVIPFTMSAIEISYMKKDLIYGKYFL